MWLSCESLVCGRVRAGSFVPVVALAVMAGVWVGSGGLVGLLDRVEGFTGQTPIDDTLTVSFRTSASSCLCVEADAKRIRCRKFEPLRPAARASGPLSVCGLLANGVSGDRVEASISDESVDHRHGRSDPGPMWVDVCRDAPRVVRRPHQCWRAASGDSAWPQIPACAG